MTNSSSLERLDCLVRDIKEGRRPLDLWSFLRVLLHHHVDAESAAHAESARRMAEFKKQAEALASLLATLHRQKPEKTNAVEVPAILQGLFDLQSARESLREYLKEVEAANAKPIWFDCAERLVAKRRAGQELGVEASGTPWSHLIGIVVGNCSTPDLDDRFIREWIVRERGYMEADPRAAELAQLNSNDYLLRDLLAEMRTKFPAVAKAWFDGLLTAARNKECNDSPMERLLFDAETQTVMLDGETFSVNNPKAFFLCKIIAEEKGEPITRADLRQRNKGLKGDKTIPNLLKSLPIPIRETIQSGAHGYWLRLPQK
jgi:hypothetical protein